MNERNCLSYWFPIIEAAGLPVPRTKIVRWPGAPAALTQLLDGVAPEGIVPFMADLAAACQEIGPFPVFLRTGHGSGKHEWSRCCYLENRAQLTQRVYALVEWSCMVDIFGLATDVWAVREFLPGDAIFTADAFGGMPVRREFRCFVDGAAVKCIHPYWPPDSLHRDLDRHPERVKALEAMNELGGDAGAVTALASRAGAALGGEWSVDVLATPGGWYVTDCAVAADSFHWPDCPAKGVEA